jgi:hypothetical protein
MESCIERFDPEIKSTDVLKYVVTGGVNKGDSIQRVNVSITSLISRPRAIPIVGCDVKIIDGKGNAYTAKDIQNGYYEVIIPECELVAGNTFKVDIQVKGGAHIVSDFDQIQDCPEVDSVYYILREIPTSTPVFPIRGIQFYLNLDADNFSCRNFRFEMTETWQYTAIYSYIADRHTCWVSSNIRSIFTLTTKNQTKNRYTLFPLHFVDNYSSQRLRYKYSLLLTQFSLSEAASDYWGKLRINSSEQGGLYENQPFQVSGNLHDLSDPDQQVLGFFGASSKKSKRIFVSEVPGLRIDYIDCRPTSWPEVPNPECIDCTAMVGGTNSKPNFWPN